MPASQSNVVADALSRPAKQSVEVNLITQTDGVIPWFDQIQLREEQRKDPYLKPIIQRLEAGNATDGSDKYFIDSDGILFMKKSKTDWIDQWHPPVSYLKYCVRFMTLP